MGCDIHMNAEVRDESGNWQLLIPKTEDSEWDYWEDTISPGRNYYLFSLLADVRNYNDLEPLSVARGLPADISDAGKEFMNYYDSDGHSHSYFTLAELFAHDWTQPIHTQSWVNVFEWANYRSEGQPRSWAGGVGGGNVRHVSPANIEMAWIKTRNKFELPEQRHPNCHLYPNPRGRDKDIYDHFMAQFDGKNPYTQVKWSVPQYEYAGALFSETLPQLVHLGAPGDIRIIFFFDN